MTDDHRSKILIGKKAIMNYLTISSKDLFAYFIRHGMPAELINNRWYAHKDNIEEFFRITTRVSRKEFSDQGE